MSYPLSIEQAKDVRTATGQMRAVLLLLCNNSKKELKTPGHVVRAIGGGATQRARDIRKGWKILEVKDSFDQEWKMLWLDPTEDHDGLYYVRRVTWEEWVKLHQERQAFELTRVNKIRADLTRKQAA